MPCNATAFRSFGAETSRIFGSSVGGCNVEKTYFNIPNHKFYTSCPLVATMLRAALGFLPPPGLPQQVTVWYDYGKMPQTLVPSWGRPGGAGKITALSCALTRD